MYSAKNPPLARGTKIFSRGAPGSLSAPPGNRPTRKIFCPGSLKERIPTNPEIAAKAQTTLAPEKGRGPLAGRIGGVLRLFPEFATEEIIRKGRRGPWGAAFPVLTKGPRSGKDRRRPIPEYGIAAVREVPGLPDGRKENPPGLKSRDFIYLWG